MSARDVVITGIGLVSSLGEGADAHWRKLSAPGVSPVVDETRYAPYIVHPMPEIDWSLQIAKRGDQRQMENWQRLGTYTAGLALDDAGIKGNDDYCSTMDMIVAAGGGERDEAVDQAILDASATRNDRDVLLNEKLTTELRPTLFLAQLSNLLAGNISIVHKVTGSSRTFMGEEGAGISLRSRPPRRVSALAARLTPWSAVPSRRNIPTCCSPTNWAATCIAAPGNRYGIVEARKAAASSPAQARRSWYWNRAIMRKNADMPPMRRSVRSLRAAPGVQATDFQRRWRNSSRRRASPPGSFLLFPAPRAPMPRPRRKRQRSPQPATWPCGGFRLSPVT